MTKPRRKEDLSRNYLPQRMAFDFFREADGRYGCSLKSLGHSTCVYGNSIEDAAQKALAITLEYLRDEGAFR